LGVFAIYNSICNVNYFILVDSFYNYF